jgi:hypothetical protein
MALFKDTSTRVILTHCMWRLDKDTILVARNMKSCRSFNTQYFQNGVRPISYKWMLFDMSNHRITSVSVNWILRCSESQTHFVVFRPGCQGENFLNLTVKIRYSEKKSLKFTVKILDLGENDPPFQNPVNTPGRPYIHVISFKNWKVLHERARLARCHCFVLCIEAYRPTPAQMSTIPQKCKQKRWSLWILGILQFSD